MNVCIFCFKDASNPEPYCPDNPGEGCHYGLDHVYLSVRVKVQRKQEKRADVNLCVKCGLHPKNPASAASDCAHEYPPS